jgi:pimeloyl-ACP methyl ester carboxylesterase
MSTGIVETPENQQQKHDDSTTNEEYDRTRRHGEAQVRRSFKAPSVRLAAMEQRASQEFLVFMATAAKLRRMARGDGHPVMVLPPFAADDTYSAPLRWVLDGQGYSVHGWRQGTNRHRTAKIVEGLPRWLSELHERGGAKVSLIGHSGGGNWARELAREFPSAIRQVITLGSPFRLRPGDTTHADTMAERLLGEQVPPPLAALIDEDDRPPIPVAVTAIYTRTDGVAAWQAGLESEGPRRENIEVVGSHCGLGYNVAAIIAIADRLAQPEEYWQPFCPPPTIRHLFPKPVYWQAGSAVG